MKKILHGIFCLFILIGCNKDREPDFFVAQDVREIRLSGLSDKPDIKLTIGYYKTNSYNAKQMFKTYRSDKVDYFSPGIDITYLTYGDHNPPVYSHERSFEDNILTINITYFGEEDD